MKSIGARLALWYAGAAMDLVRGKLGRPRFLVFSDDIEWCKRSGVFSVDCEFMATNRFGDNPAIDLLLMSLCSHHIIANSTYSWWAAWAQFRPDKICVIPRMWTASRTADSLGLVHPNFPGRPGQAVVRLMASSVSSLSSLAWTVSSCARGCPVPSTRKKLISASTR